MFKNLFKERDKKIKLKLEAIAVDNASPKCKRNFINIILETILIIKA
jgi:hypothetical protein